MIHPNLFIISLWRTEQKFITIMTTSIENNKDFNVLRCTKLNFN